MLQIAMFIDHEEMTSFLQQSMTHYLNNIQIPFHIECFNDESSLIHSFNNQTFDLIFIKPNTNLISYIKHTNIHQLIVFVEPTLAHIQESYTYHVFDYITLPLDETRIQTLLNDAMSYLLKHAPYMHILINKTMKQIRYDEFLYVTTSGHYLYVHTTNKTYKIRSTFKQFLNQIPCFAKRFLCINQGILVNLDHVQSMIHTTCTMDNGDILPIRVKSSHELIQAYEAYHFKRSFIVHNKTHFKDINNGSAI